MSIRVFAGGRNGLTSVDGSDSGRTTPPMHSGQENMWREARLDNGVQIQGPLCVGF